MGNDSLASPHRRSQNPSLVFAVKKPISQGVGSCSALIERHRFLLTMLVLLVFLCAVYLYFAVTLGATEPCAGLTGTEKALCLAKSSAIHKRKLKLF